MDSLQTVLQNLLQNSSLLLLLFSFLCPLLFLFLLLYVSTTAPFGDLVLFSFRPFVFSNSSATFLYCNRGFRARSKTRIGTSTSHCRTGYPFFFLFHFFFFFFLFVCDFVPSSRPFASAP
jgi:hypothetical protein